MRKKKQRNFLWEIAEHQRQGEKDLIIDPREDRLLREELLASAETKARDVGVVTSKFQPDFYTQLTYSSNERQKGTYHS